MGIFHKLGSWLTEKSDRFIRGEADGGYYATQEAQQAYGNMGAEDMENEEGAQMAREPLDPFGRGEGEYGGRKPYRSRYDLEREAQQQTPPVNQQAAPQPTPPQMGQPQMAQPQMGQPQMGHSQQAAYQQGNVVQFPGMQRSADGSVYAHVEYIVLMRSRHECKDVIAYMKANASVFLNMEFIASDSERQRCVDMISGAAYTLGCELTKISPRGIYLISSPSVRVVLDPAMQKFTAAPDTQGFVRQRYESESYQQQAYAQQPEPMQETQHPMNGFSAGSPTTRFQAQAAAAQGMPTSFGSVMAGNATGMYQPVAATGRYSAVQQ